MFSKSIMTSTRSPLLYQHPFLISSLEPYREKNIGRYFKSTCKKNLNINPLAVKINKLINKTKEGYIAVRRKVTR